MGLDITAYRKIKRIGDIDPDYCDSAKNNVTLYVNTAFPKQADSITNGLYEYEGKSFGFRAGSYSWYNLWRNELAKFVGHTDDEIWKNHNIQCPFVELIDFADNEGVIGPETSKKLYKDFKDNLKRAMEYKPDPDVDDMSEWFIVKYKVWMKAFELASANGCVQFH